MKYGIVKVWNGMEDLLMEWKEFLYFHTFCILAHFNVVLILNAFNKANQMHKMIKEKVVFKSLFK